MKTIYFAPRTEQTKILNIYQVLGPSGDVGITQTPAVPTYPGGGD